MYPAIPPRPGYPPPLRLPERPDEAEPPAGALRQSLSEYDRRLGLGATGPILSSARQVAQSEWVTGEATLEVIADRSGLVRSVRVVNASQDTDGWRRYAEELQAAPASNLRLPEEARGVWTLIFVRAANERATGSHAWWSPGVAFTFDLSNIASKKTRTVHSHVLSEVWF